MRAWLPLLLIGLAAPLAGCGAGSDGGADGGVGGGEPARYVLRTETATVLVSRPTEEGMLSLLDGAVTVTDGCLGIDDNVLIWPPGTDVAQRDPLVISVPHLGRFHVGSHVRVSGGFVQQMPDSPADLEGIPLVPDVPAACAQDSIWLAGPSG